MIKRIRRLDKQRARSRATHGFTLLEVILALAILAGSIALIGEVMRNGMRNSYIARNQATAQFLCESKLSEVLAQAVELQAVSGATFENEPDWTYSIDFETIEEGLLAVYVTVAPIDAPPGSRDEFTLVRWMRDPEAVYADEQAAQEGSSASGSGTSGTGSGSGSSSGGSLR